MSIDDSELEARSAKAAAQNSLQRGDCAVFGGRLAIIRKVITQTGTWVDTGKLCYFHDIKYHPETKSWLAFIEHPDGTLALMGMEQIRLIDRQEWLNQK